MAATFVLAVPLWFAFQGNPVGRGDVVEAALTVTPEDATGLACEQAWAWQRYSCEFVAGNTRFEPAPRNADRIQPFVSVDRALYLIPGVFFDPSVSRFAATLPRTQRFTARCKIRLLTRTHDARIRFRPDAPWDSPKEPLWLAEPVSCVAE